MHARAHTHTRLSNSELANKYTKLFQKFMNSINFLMAYEGTKRTRKFNQKPVNEQNRNNKICKIRPNNWNHKNLNSVEDKTKHVILHV
jgi:hypothetical protein